MASDDLGERTGYRFRDAGLERQVFSHRSFRHEYPGRTAADNERLEFLGDAVLEFVVSRMLFEHFPRAREGELSRLRAHLVSAQHLAGKARALDLGRELMLGRGEELSGGRDKDSILADVYESLLAGIFLDGGLDAAVEFIEREFTDDVASLEGARPVRDYKSLLQEELHAQGSAEPRYDVVGESGPDHRKTFVVAVTIDGDEVAHGEGGSKKAAQQDAARAALERRGWKPPA